MKSFTVGAIVETNESPSRTGKVRDIQGDVYQVCFDDAETVCALFGAGELTLYGGPDPATTSA